MATITEAVQGGDFGTFWNAMKDHPDYSGFMETYEASTDQDWKTDAKEAIRNAFNAEHMEVVGSGGLNLEGIMQALGMIFKGDFQGGISQLMNAFNGAADPAALEPLDQARDAAIEAAKGHDPNFDLGAVTNRIDAIKPG